MDTPSREDAKRALDVVIKKARVHFYKPIQIAEILYRHRTVRDIDLLSVDSYRVKSKEWRDAISLPLLGRICTSSCKYQDDLFSATAIPPDILEMLGRENLRIPGIVESYIYRKFINKYEQLSNALSYCMQSEKSTFSIKKFIDSFWVEPGLRRSIDKIYEIIVYALFQSLSELLDVRVEISINQDKIGILNEFEDFVKKIMAIDISKMKVVQNAKIYRVGVTNAADRGLDMYSNWGPAIQVKHLSLSVELAENIVNSVSSDKVVIVCKDAEMPIIISLLSQIGWRARIQSIVTESDLISWYDKALHGSYSEDLADRLIKILQEEIEEEFPSVSRIPQQILDRHYEKISDPYWI